MDGSTGRETTGRRTLGGDATFSVPFPAATGYRCPFVVVRFSGRLTLRYQTHYAARNPFMFSGVSIQRAHQRLCSALGFLAHQGGAAFVSDLKRQGHQAPADNSQRGPLDGFTPRRIEVVPQQSGP